jgi:hypothetical protein
MKTTSIVTGYLPDCGNRQRHIQDQSNQVLRCIMSDSFQHITVPVTGGIELEAQLHPAKPTDGVQPKINDQGV